MVAKDFAVKVYWGGLAARSRVFLFSHPVGVIGRSPYTINPNRSLDRLLYSFSLFQVSLCHISISFGILSTSLSRVARYDFASDVANLLETNTNLA